MTTAIRRQRWVLKKAGRTGIGAIGTLGRLKRSLGGRVRVLTYHRFGICPRDPFCIAPAEFEAQMAFLAARGLAISLADLQAFLDGEKELPAGAVLVTTDDGYRSVLTEMLPVLQRYRIPAVAFVSASLIGTGQPDGAPEPYLTWEEARGLVEQGIAVESHAMTHRSLAQLPGAEARQEAIESRRLIEQETGRTVTAFAYPYGTRADYDIASARILRAAGYLLGFTSQHGAIRRGPDDRLMLPRIKVEAGDPGWLFPQLCHGALDGWRLVDDFLWKTQQVR
jgi:peptidoglycan/xylan/chitin deacetylase (PgdA/CDA1 family)